jgi:hypothetical protein
VVPSGDHCGSSSSSKPGLLVRFTGFEPSAFIA